MMIKPTNTVVTTEALASAVTIDEVRAHLGLFSDTSFDDILGDMSIAATEYVGQLIDTYIEPTVLRSNYCRFESRMSLDNPHVTSVQSISYMDGNRMSQTIMASDYFLDNTGKVSTVVFPELPTVELSQLHNSPVAITYTINVNAVDLNPQLKQAILITIQDWFENRGTYITGTTVSELPVTAMRLIQRYKRFNV